MTQSFRIFFLMLLLLCRCSAPEKQENSSSGKLRVFIDEFVTSKVEAASKSEMNAAFFLLQLQKTKGQLATLRSIDPLELKGDDLIDWKFAQSILAGRELQQEKMLPWKKNPRLYMTFTDLSTVIDSPLPLDDKVKQIEERLKLIPIQLGNAMNQLEVYIPRFQELSLFMAENGLVLFDKELPAFITMNPTTSARLLASLQDGRNSLEKFIAFLKVELPKKPQGDFAIGKEVYEAMMKHQFLLDYDADSLWKFGWDRFKATVKELEALAKTIDSRKTWQQLALEFKNEHPEPHKIIEVSQEWVDKSRAHVLARNLIPIPWKERVKVTARVEYLRKTSYYGNFSFAKELDKDSMYTSDMMINPFEDQWDDKKKQEFLLEHDWGVIIVTAPHETYAGHHVQGLYQLHNPRPLRKNNSISLFSEGWGLYNEQLMQETGFFTTEKIHLRQLQLRLWRNARVIYDVGLHSGKMSYEEAISLMTDQVGFLRWASQLEVDASTASPGYFIGYFTGMSEILAMREEYKMKMGNAFTLSDFHERLLKIGSMPPSLMREALMNN